MSMNYLSETAGASVLDVSHEANALGSACNNVLLEQEDLIWIANPPPQHITVALPEHRPLFFVGWYVWHDYLTNPKVVEVSSGPDAAHLTHAITCTAYSGAGVQLWELTKPIPSEHRVLRFDVKSTFGGSYTYINRLYAFETHPGNDVAPRARSPPRSIANGTPPRSVPRQQRAAELAPVAQNPRSPGQASEFGSPFSALRDLDKEIRSLHQIRVSAPPTFDLSGAHNHDRSERSVQPGPEHAERPEAHELSDIANERIATLERSVMGLVNAMNMQTRQLEELREEIGGQRRADRSQSTVEGDSHHPQRPPGPSARTGAPTGEGALPFPDAALRAYVEDVMAPRLAKHSRRFEARITQRMDEHLEEILRSVNDTVEDRVAAHMRRIASESDERYSHVAGLRGIRPPSSSSQHRRSVTSSKR